MLVYREVYKKGKLTGSMSSGVIHLIYKKGGKKDIRNWIPITVLTTIIKF